MDSALRRYSVVLARLSQTRRLAEGVAGRFFGQSPGRGQLGARMQDAGRDQRYDPIPLRRKRVPGGAFLRSGYALTPKSTARTPPGAMLRSNSGEKSPP